jgi:hypothetical protein
MTTRDEALIDIASTLSVLTLDERDMDFDFVVSHLATLKGEIDAFEGVLHGSEPWLATYLSKAHVKGAILFVGAKTNYRKQLADGRKWPFTPEVRDQIMSRFNSWGPDTLERLSTYEESDRSAAIVAPWIVALDRFKADPTHND